jgi:predicted Zn-dependent peptidase
MPSQAPVFRELYSEKRVVAEERRARIDNSAMGRFQEDFLQAALTNNYRRPVIGYERDVAALGRREVEAFFRERYGPRNLVIAIVGDTTPDRVSASWVPSCAALRSAECRQQDTYLQGVTRRDP